LELKSRLTNLFIFKQFNYSFTDFLKANWYDTINIKVNKLECLVFNMADKSKNIMGFTDIVGITGRRIHCKLQNGYTANYKINYVMHCYRVATNKIHLNYFKKHRFPLIDVLHHQTLDEHVLKPSCQHPLISVPTIIIQFTSNVLKFMSISLSPYLTIILQER